MVSSPIDGIYWDTHFPLGLYNFLQELKSRNVKNPNTPNSSNVVTVDKEWLSLPRGASEYSIKHSVYTFADAEDFFTAEGIQRAIGGNNRTRDYGTEIDQSQTGYGAEIGRSLDPKVFDWFPVSYNSNAFPLNVGVNAAVEKAIKMIMSRSSKVFLIGFGKGAVVASKLYNEFRTGRLVSRRSDLLGVYNFGNPMREAGHTIPGGIAVPGHGIAAAPLRLVGTEELVWEFAAPGDPLSGTGDDLLGELATLIYTYYDTLITGPATLLSQLEEIISSPIFGRLPVLLPFRLAVTSGESINIPKLLRTLIKELFSDGGSHDKYEYFYPYPDKKLNAIDVATNSILSKTIATPPEVVGKSETEVLSVNYRQPVSVSEITFDILRKNCYIEMWFLDRSGNWRQMLRENSSPITIRVGHSDSVSWYNYSEKTYPIVAKAIQFRITRVADPLIGNKSYSVGIKNVLVRRNVYDRSSGLQALDDENDALGNVISKTIKDWDAAKAIDDNTNTFWKSSPQPDPDAVVSFYLDTRDSFGEAQLIDKIYLDPVYSGQSLNLYYSNDGTTNSKKLNPASLIPVAEYRIGMTTAATGNGSIATLTLDSVPNLSVGDEVTISEMSPSGYNGTYTLTDVSRVVPYSISFANTTRAAQAAGGAGIVTANGKSNFEWVQGKGLKDKAGDTSNSVYRFPLSTGPMVSQDCWIGIQWTPSFDAFAQKSVIAPMSTKGVVKAGTTATISLGTTSNVSVGEKFTIVGMQPDGYNGTHTAIQSPSSDSVSFTTAITGSQTQSGILITENFYPGIKNIPTTACTGTGTTATITLQSKPNVVAGDFITISGMTPVGYNGTYTVTSASSSSPWTVSFSCPATGSQIDAGTVSTGARVKIINIASASFDTIHSVYDSTTKEVIYTKHIDYESCSFDNTKKILRLPPENVSADCLSSDQVTIYYGVSGPAQTQLNLLEVVPDNIELSSAPETQCWPRIFYDSSTAEIVLEMLQSDGSPKTYSAPLDLLFEANTPLNIVVGWRYVDGSDPIFYATVRTGRQLTIASTESAEFGFPQRVTIDGKVGFRQWRGTFGAHIIKHESYLSSSESFLANPSAYCNPDPILVAPTGTTTPTISLDQALMAVDWSSQQFAAGGSHSSSYSDKEWTPIWVNYFAEKGFLYLPETISMKYLKLEFSQLTAEPYPVYDEGVKVSYMVYPITVTQTSSRPKGLVGALNNIFGGIGSVNWLNPASVNQAVNSIYGRTVQPVQTTIQVGPGTVYNTLPNATPETVAEATRTEANSPWVYRRTPMNATTLALNFFENRLFSRNHGIKAITAAATQKAIEADTAISRPTSATPPAVPIQGEDWYIFPGQTLRMPANVINGLSRSQVVTRRNNSKAVRTRFTTTAVHQYETKTVTLDASVAYFAGIREVQPYVVTYVDYEDPPEFLFDTYDSATGWSLVNIEKLSTGPVTAKENPYWIPNSRFNANLDYWFGEGWSWDYSQGYTLDTKWVPGTAFSYGSARTTANGTNRQLISEPINVNAGAYINFAAWMVYRNITYTPGSGAKIYVDLVGLDINDNVIASSISLGNRMEVGVGTNTYFFSTNQPCSSVPQLGVAAVPLYGSVNLGLVNSNIRKVQVRLNVNSSVTAGDVWFDDIDMAPQAGVIGSAVKEITTHAKFSKVRCEFNDSGTRKSDPMWVYLDSDSPNRSILAPYVSTEPVTIPDGVWKDSFNTWKDSDTAWGTPYSAVSINYSEETYDKKRVIHFYREAASEGNTTAQAGISVRQNRNFIPGSNYRICATFFKKKKTSNSMNFRLARLSGRTEGEQGPNQYDNGIVYTEWLGSGSDGLTPEGQSPVLKDVPTGFWYTHQGHWARVPDGQDQIYKLELVLVGTEQDDLYLNDLWVEIAPITYYVQLGSGIRHNITPYADNSYVGSTEPVNSMTIEVEIHGSNNFLIPAIEDAIAASETKVVASMSISQPTILSAFEYTFTNDDIGKYVWVEGASGVGKALRTSIIGTSNGNAVLAMGCNRTVTNVQGRFGKSSAVSKQNASFAYSSAFTPLYLQ
jgi:hypothetical protein